MKRIWLALFGGHGQVWIGAACLVVGLAFWLLGTVIIKGAAALPWHWTSAAFIFHASMFFGEVACYAIIATGLGFKATERVEAQVAEVSHADEVNVKA